MPDAWVQKIFAGMGARYGTLFLDRWRGCDLDEVMRTWSEDLASFADCPEAIGAALAALKDECPLPPTLPEFVRLCRRHYRPPQRPALPPPAPLSQAEAAERARAAESVARKPSGYNHKAWAKELRRRYLSGECLLTAQIASASAALGEVWSAGACRPASDAGVTA